MVLLARSRLWFSDRSAALHGPARVSRPILLQAYSPRQIASTEGDDGPAAEALRLLHDRLTAELKAAGVVRIEAKGNAFDPSKMEAITTVPATDEHPAGQVIEELEEPPMPPLVEDNIVIAPYVVSDFVRLGKQLDRDHLVRATMGSLAMIHPERHDVMIATKHMVTLPRMNERSLCVAPLGSTSPRGAPTDWHVLEVVLASVAMVTGGPAAVIHMHGPHTTAASCEQDLVLLTPIDELGKQHIGKIIIVDPDPDHPEDYLRQVAEALNQGGMRCVVVRGNGAYAVGADFDQAWANAAMLEHSMHIHLLARQANLKI